MGTQDRPKSTSVRPVRIEAKTQLSPKGEKKLLILELNMSDSVPEVDSNFPKLFVSAWSELEDSRRKS